MSVATAHMVREILGEILDTPIGQLNHGRIHERLGALRAALPDFSHFVEDANRMVDQLRSGAPVKAASARSLPRAKRTSPPTRRGRPSRDGFRPTSFILETVAAAGERGVSPSELIARVEELAPGREGRAGNVVSPLLNRLKKRGEVTNRDGRWFLK